MWINRTVESIDHREQRATGGQPRSPYATKRPTFEELDLIREALTRAERKLPGLARLIPINVDRR